jgi:hypothetical protein
MEYLTYLYDHPASILTSYINFSVIYHDQDIKIDARHKAETAISVDVLFLTHAVPTCCK